MTAAPFDLAALDAAGWGPGPLAGVLTTSTAAATPSPSPSGPSSLDPTDVSPGVVGFLPVFLIALACIGLFLSLTSKLRKVNRKQAQIDAEEAAAADGGAGAGANSTGPDDAAADGSGR